MHIDLVCTPITDASGQPMVTVRAHLPRLVIGGELYPNELRELARQMVTIAIDAEMIGEGSKEG